MWKQNAYDIIIVGGGVVGCSLAHALATLPTASETPLKILLLERSLVEPDRIVGELLQPGGVESLRKLGLEWTLEGIDAAPARGYCVLDPEGNQVHIPYHPAGEEGRGFHHGRFIMKLREAAMKAKGVDVVEATVTELLECDLRKRVIGVKACKKGDVAEKEEDSYFASLTIIADGCFSNFRSTVLGSSFLKPVTKSHFVGLVLEDAKLPVPNHGTVVLCKDQGPVLLYAIGSRETRMLVDVKTPVPDDLRAHIKNEIVPRLPKSLQPPVLAGLQKDRLRRMPNSFLPPVPQYPIAAFPLLTSVLTSIGLKSPQPAPKENIFLVGDAWNMRHPLTGGGMTVAFHDVVILRDRLASLVSHAKEEVISSESLTTSSKSLGPLPILRNWMRLQEEVLVPWYWERRDLGATVNILSVALYDLFGGDDEELSILRNGCFKYFERGGACITEPVGLLSGLASHTSTLFRHFFCVAFYSIYVLFTSPPFDPKQRSRSFFGNLVMAVRVFYTAVVVFTPLLWSEMRWWMMGLVNAWPFLVPFIVAGGCFVGMNRVVADAALAASGKV